MKGLKKAVALLLVMVMALSLATCGGKSDIIGTWQGRVDMTELITDELDESIEELLDSMDLPVELSNIGDYLGNFDPVFVCIFNADGTFSMKVDEASLDTELDEYKQGLEGFFRYFFAELLSQTLVEMGLAEQINSEEELEAILGVSLDEAISEAMGMELSAYVSEVIDEELGKTEDIAELFNSEGKYKTKDGKLWLSAGLEYNVDPEIYDLYSITGGKTLTIEEGTPSQDNTSLLYPMVLQKTA